MLALVLPVWPCESSALETVAKQCGGKMCCRFQIIALAGKIKASFNQKRNLNLYLSACGQYWRQKEEGRGEKKEKKNLF